MRCRNMVKTGKGHQIVFFGSYGKDLSGNAIKADNYVEKGEALAKLLTQKLSVIRKELWFNVSFGLPLIDKSSKIMMDATVADIIMHTDDVKDILEFKSTIVDKTYKCTVKILSTFGTIVIQ